MAMAMETAPPPPPLALAKAAALCAPRRGKLARSLHRAMMVVVAAAKGGEKGPE
jgi:hypothetical protein